MKTKIFCSCQERGKAYEQETGKRLATHADIENVLNELRKVTRETETIKAQIASDYGPGKKYGNNGAKPISRF